MNPARAALFTQDDSSRGSRGADRSRRQEPANQMQNVNPERALLLEQRDDKSGGRSRGNDGRGRSSRNQSPRRAGGRHVQDQGGQPPTAPAEDRHARSQPAADSRGSGRNRDRSPGSARHQRDRDEGAFKGTPGRGPDNDRQVPSHQDPNYGRLNPVPSGPETPSGPRPRGRGAARSAQNTPTGPSNRGDNRPSEQGRPPSPARQPPTGPASGRGRRGGYEPNGPHNSGSPAGPAADRQRHGQKDADKAVEAGVHPDRLSRVDAGPPPPPPPPPPGGPSGAHRNGPGLDGVIPTGPAASQERHRGGRRQLAGINNTLQQSQGPGPEPSRNMPRPNQPRQMLANSDVQVLAGGSPASTPGQEPGRYMDAPRGPANGEDGSGHGHGRRDHRQDRHGRQSHGDFRDRRSAGGPDAGPRDDRGDSRRGGNASASEPMPPMNPGGGGRDRHRGDGAGGGGRGQEEWNHSRGGGGGNRGGGDRREDRGRKRRSEEGVGGMGNDHRDKRARR